MCILDTENGGLLEFNFVAIVLESRSQVHFKVRSRASLLVNLNVLNITHLDVSEFREIVSYPMDLNLFFYLKLISRKECPKGKYQISYSLSFKNPSISKFHLVTEVRM